MKPAFLIVDVQAALCTGPDAAFDIDRIIERINRLAGTARAAQVPVVYVQHEDEEAPLQYGAPGWQLDARLDTRPDEPCIRKTACNSFHETDLQALLTERGVDTLIVCGLQSDFCIDATVRGAFSLGYGVTLAADAHSTVDNHGVAAAQISGQRNAALGMLEDKGRRVEVTMASDIRMMA
jgi:nicotinamidase-related amidase